LITDGVPSSRFDARSALVCNSVMTRRDHYTWDLECPRCKRTGRADVSENAAPYESGLGFSVDEISEGFGIGKLGFSACDTVIVCFACDIPV
jgi:hypothetical protein